MILTGLPEVEQDDSVSDPEDRIIFRTDDADMLDSAVKTCLQYYGTEAGPVSEGTEQTDKERIDYLLTKVEESSPI
jgi:hypothetical protein